jgi:hypothetical protein
MKYCRKEMLFMLMAGAVVCRAPAWSSEVLVTLSNLSPGSGTLITPVWVGFHDGTFDLYDSGAAASSSLERIAEDGDTAPLTSVFTSLAAGTNQATLTGPNGPLAPGESASMTFSLDGMLAADRYFSYASMVIPSNDAFIANGDPMAHPIFAADGSFLGANFVVLGTSVLDAGTEVNDELPANTAAFGQTVPDTGVVENGTVQPHPGFNPVGSGGILDAPAFQHADFLAAGYQVARVSVTLVPEPASSMLASLGVVLLGIGPLRRIRRFAAMPN